MSASREPVTVIVAPMEDELAFLRKKLQDVRPVPVKGAAVVVGRLGGAPVAVAVTGDGERNARGGLASVLAAVSAREIVALGVAGALDPASAVGDVVVCEHVLAEDGLAVHAADAELAARALRHPGSQRGIAVTSRDLADRPERKAALRALAGSEIETRGWRSAVAVVDLESAVFAAAANRAEIPWVVVRAVSDRADESLPPLLNASRDEGGAVRRGRVVRGLLTQPSLLKPLLALRERVRSCAVNLTAVVETMLRARVHVEADPLPIRAPQVKEA
jgi:nucleoside phosphorylase